MFFMLYFSRKNMAGVMWTPPGTMTTMSWPNSSSMARRWGSSEMLNTAWSNSDWTYGRRVPSAFSQDDLVRLSVCLSVAALSHVPDVTEYFDPLLKILALALISQKKWAPSHKRHLIFYLNINSTTKFSCF